LTVGNFGAVGKAYQDYSEGIRGRIRHELVFETLSKYLTAESKVLDMGCGDGEISLRLGRAGHTVVGVDISAEMLELAEARLRAEPDEVIGRVTFQRGDIADFSQDRTFDAVCCHGVLMYLERSDTAIGRLAGLVAPGGLLSVLTKNLLAAGVREALRGDYAAALAQVIRTDGIGVGNLGISTRGDDPWKVLQIMKVHGLTDCQWYGIRMFSDHLQEPSMAAERFQQLLALEAEVSHRDPYRYLGRLFHAVAFRPLPT
jgi:S-adenosylmethionine-dependent methyltransferase